MTEQAAKSLSIAQKILMFTLLVAVVPLSLNWFVNYTTTSDEIEQQSAAQLDRMAEGLARYVDVWVDMNVRMLRQNALNADIKSMETERQTPVLRNIVKTFDWNYLAFTVDVAGNNVGRSDDNKARFYGDRDYVQSVLSGDKLATQVLVGKTSGKPALVLAVPVYSQFGRLHGVLAIAMTLAELSTEITDIRIGRSGNAFLLDDSGRVIAHSNQEFTRTRKDLSAHPAFAAARPGGPRRVDYSNDGVRTIASVVRTGNDWTLVAEQHYAEAFSPVTRTNQIALLLLVVTLLLVAGLSILIARRLTDPIRHLTEVAEAISRGKLGEQVGETERGDELGALARAIARLGASVRFAMEKLSQRAG